MEDASDSSVGSLLCRRLPIGRVSKKSPNARPDRRPAEHRSAIRQITNQRYGYEVSTLDHSALLLEAPGFAGALRAPRVSADRSRGLETTLRQFHDKSSGVWDSSRYFQPFWRRIICQSSSGFVLNTRSIEEGWVSQASRFNSSSSWPGLQPA